MARPTRRERLHTLLATLPGLIDHAIDRNALIGQTGVKEFSLSSNRRLSSCDEDDGRRAFLHVDFELLDRIPAGES